MISRNTILLLLVLLICIACTRSIDPGIEAGTDVSEHLKQQKTSELALMMRQYHELAKQMRVQIIDHSGKNLPKPDKSPLVWKTATATDMSVKGDAFNAFTDHFSLSLNSIYESEHKQVVESYNLLIASCISCHQQFCPGPIRTIRKLAIEQ
jgi:cytochrome c556